MVEPVVIFGSLLFWLATAVFFIAALIFTSLQKHGRAFLAVALYAGAIVAFTDANPLPWVQANWLYLVYGAVAYLVIGVGYMIFRWKRQLVIVDNTYGELRQEFMKNHELTTISTQAQRDDLLKFMSNRDRLRKLGIYDGNPHLHVRDNKARLTGWMVSWPLSALDYLIGNLLVDLVNSIYRAFAGMMQGMSDRQFAKYEEFNGK